MPLLKAMFSFRGRTGRLFYWTFCTVHSAMYCVAAVLFYFAADRHLRPDSALGSYAILAFVLGTAIFFLPVVAVATRRLHDRGHSGWRLVLGIALAFLAVATVLKHAPSFAYAVPPRDFIQAAPLFAATAALGFLPWSAAVLYFARGDAAYSYILPALFGVGPLLIFGLWFLIDVGLRRGVAAGNADDLPSTGSGGPLAEEAGPRQWLPISGAAVASIAGIVLLTGVLESHTMPCDMAQSITPATTSTAREFEDCFEIEGKRACGPRMVEIPAGSFQMGSNDAVSMPIHTVTFAKSFAIGKFEVTAAQWETCVADGGCKNVNPEPWQQRSRDITGSRCRKPAGPDWNRITTEYLPWLSRKTGKAYRLPSESEWEYAARAGTTSKFTTGDRISSEYENFDDSAPGRAKTIKGNWIDVGSLKPNPFGLHDMLGNSEEWVADIYNWNRYERAPIDGSAWTQAMQQSVLGDMRVVRGGHWASKPDVLSPTRREGRFPEKGAGFRVALTLPAAASVATGPASSGSVSAEPVMPNAVTPQPKRADAGPPTAGNSPSSAADAWKWGEDSSCWQSPNPFSYSRDEIRQLNLARLGYCERTIAYQIRAGMFNTTIARSHYSRGDAFRQLGRLDEAMAEFKLAAARSPGDAASFPIAEIHLEKKEFRQALEIFDAYKGVPHASQMLGRAQALEGLRRTKDAIAAYEEFDRIFGTSVATDRRIAHEALVRLGARKAGPVPDPVRKSLSAAEKAAVKPSEICSRSPPDWTVDEKIAACTQTIADEEKGGAPFAGEVYFKRAHYYLDKRDFARAASDFSRLIDSRSVHIFAAYYGRGLAYEGLGKKTEAISDWRLVNRQDPCDRSVREGLTRLGHEPLPLPGGCQITGSGWFGVR